jgi:5-methylcytosine-specific restriction endonuclease McrA
MWYNIFMAEKKKDIRTYADRRVYNIQAVSKRRRAIKAMAIKYKGGECQVCGYKRYQGALDLHHLDPKQKEFSMSDKGHSRSWERVKEELDKCVLVCANCHREVEGGIISV